MDLSKTDIESLRNSKVLVIGDIGLDRYMHGAVERISPEAPVPVMVEESTECRLGMAANVAANIASLGGQARLLGVVGADFDGWQIRRMCRDRGIKDLILELECHTTVKTRFISERHQLLRVDREDGLPLRTNNLLSSALLAAFEDCDIVVVQDYAKGIINKNTLTAIFDAAKKTNKIIMVDPSAKTPLEYYRGANVIVPNLKESHALTGFCSKTTALKDIAGFLQSKIAAAYDPIVVIKLGKDGIAWLRGSEFCIMPTVARQVYDVSGAGDTVVAMLALAFASELDLPVAVTLANAAAGIVVGKPGTATVTKKELVEAVGVEPTSEHASDGEST